MAHDAARAGDVEAIRTALAADPDAVNQRDKHARTPLHLAAWSGHADAVKLLCDMKSPVNAAAMDDMSALHFACQKGHLQVVKELMSAGASINSRSRKGLTPLHLAVQGNHKDLAVYLVKRGSNLSVTNRAGKSPLDLAGRELREAIEGESLAVKTRKEAKEAERAEIRARSKGGEEKASKKPKVSLSHLEGDDGEVVGEN